MRFSVRFAVLPVLVFVATGAFAYTGEKLEKTAKFKMTEAQAIALKARPGQIVDLELEREAGGSGLRYSFDIKVKAVTYEVGVDAQTRKILENGREGKNHD